MKPNQTTSYGTYPADSYADYQDFAPTSTYEQGYVDYSPRAAYGGVTPQAAAEASYNHVSSPTFQPSRQGAQLHTYPAAREANSGTLIVEILCSLFGIYGVGWRMAGEKTLGTLLLVCSFVIIWPLAIAIAIVTFGFGIPLCDLPLAITGIIINAVLLNNRLNRQSLPPLYSQAPPQARSRPMNMPPPQ